MVDIFIPVVVNNLYRMPAALYSALTQTYQDKRIIIFMDHVHEGLEKFLDGWWYTTKDNPRANIIDAPYSKATKTITLEYCSRGVLVRNPNGPMGSAGFARQWIFEWGGKSDYVKFLDSDDMLLPDCLHYMIASMTPDCAGVICPLVFISAYRHGQLYEAGAGSGSYLFKKSTMEKIVSDGFVWGMRPGHDKGLREHIKEKGYKFVTTGLQNALYLYIK